MEDRGFTPLDSKHLTGFTPLDRFIPSDKKPYLTGFTPLDSKHLTGFTLIEVIMVIVVVGALAVGTAPFLNAVIDRWTFLEFRNEVGMQARHALDWLVREAKEVNDKNSFSIADSARLKFTNSDSVSIDYSLSGKTLKRNNDDLADYVDSLQFEYRDQQGNLLTPLPLNATQMAQIWRISITLTIKRTATKASKEETLTLKSDVFPRNLGI